MPAPGMAAANALEREPKTFKQAVLSKRFQPILRTGRRKAAGWAQPGRDGFLIKKNDPDEWQA